MALISVLKMMPSVGVPNVRNTFLIYQPIIVVSLAEMTMLAISKQNNIFFMISAKCAQ